LTKGTHQTQSDAVCDALRQLIVHTELKPGEPIEEAAIMSRLKTGRTPLREALWRLTKEDLIRHLPNRGYFVSEISAADLMNVFEIRESLEVLSARLSAERARPEHIRDFEMLLEDARRGVARKNEDLTWNVGVDQRFHRLLADAAANGFLPAAIDRYYAISARVLYLSRMQMALVSDEIGNYEAMFVALQRRDPDAAEAVMRRHMSFDPISLASPPRSVGALTPRLSTPPKAARGLRIKRRGRRTSN
jgi:DNA-binding GntR family transcriptional regulator